MSLLKIPGSVSQNVSGYCPEVYLEILEHSLELWSLAWQPSLLQLHSYKL